MKKNQVLKIVLLILILCLLILIIQSTYSKYVSSKSTNSSLYLASWNLVINNTNILKKQDFSYNLKMIVDPNPNVYKNTIAPTSTGHFEIILNSTGTTIPFDYIITLNPDKTDYNNVADYKITSYSEDGGAITPLPTDVFNFTGHINPAVDASGNISVTENNEKRLTFYTQWIDTPDDITVLNNIDDIKASKIPNSQCGIPLKLTVTQSNP